MNTFKSNSTVSAIYILKCLLLTDLGRNTGDEGAGHPREGLTNQRHPVLRRQRQVAAIQVQSQAVLSIRIRLDP